MCASDNIREDVMRSVVSCIPICADHCVVCMAGQKDGETPLYIAAESGYVEIVRMLVRAGVAVNKAKVCDHG